MFLLKSSRAGVNRLIWINLFPGRGFYARKLSKFCFFFYIFIGVEPEPFELGEHLVYASGKFTVF